MERYIKEKELGRGSFGVVNLCKDKQKDLRIVVVKTISFMPEDKNENNKKWKKNSVLDFALKEVQVLSSVNHPFIVDYYDSFQEKDNLMIVMEYCPNGDLCHLLKSKGRLSEAVCLLYGQQLAEALEYLHGKNILHRDLKPRNVFLAQNWDIRLGDFGVCKIKDNTADLASTMIGTPLYFSPEICSNTPYNEKSDVWGLGCLLYLSEKQRNEIFQLYEMICGSPPFQGKTPASIVMKIVTETPQSKLLCTLMGNKHITNCVIQCLYKRPNRRPTCSLVRQVYTKAIDNLKRLQVFNPYPGHENMSSSFIEDNQQPIKITSDCPSRPPLAPKPSPKSQQSSNIPIISARSDPKVGSNSNVEFEKENQQPQQLQHQQAFGFGNVKQSAFSPSSGSWKWNKQKTPLQSNQKSTEQLLDIMRQGEQGYLGRNIKSDRKITASRGGLVSARCHQENNFHPSQLGGFAQSPIGNQLQKQFFFSWSGRKQRVRQSPSSQHQWGSPLNQLLSKKVGNLIVESDNQNAMWQDLDRIKNGVNSIQNMVQNQNNQQPSPSASDWQWFNSAQKDESQYGSTNIITDEAEAADISDSDEIIMDDCEHDSDDQSGAEAEQQEYQNNTETTTTSVEDCMSATDKYIPLPNMGFGKPPRNGFASGGKPPTPSNGANLPNQQSSNSSTNNNKVSNIIQNFQKAINKSTSSGAVEDSLALSQTFENGPFVGMALAPDSISWRSQSLQCLTTTQQSVSSSVASNSNFSSRRNSVRSVNSGSNVNTLVSKFESKPRISVQQWFEDDANQNQQNMSNQQEQCQLQLDSGLEQQQGGQPQLLLPDSLLRSNQSSKQHTPVSGGSQVQVQQQRTLFLSDDTPNNIGRKVENLLPLTSIDGQSQSQSQPSTTKSQKAQAAASWVQQTLLQFEQWELKQSKSASWSSSSSSNWNQNQNYGKSIRGPKFASNIIPSKFIGSGDKRSERSTPSAWSQGSFNFRPASRERGRSDSKDSSGSGMGHQPWAQHQFSWQQLQQSQKQQWQNASSESNHVGLRQQQQNPIQVQQQMRSSQSNYNTSQDQQDWAQSIKNIPTWSQSPNDWDFLAQIRNKINQKPSPVSSQGQDSPIGSYLQQGDQVEIRMSRTNLKAGYGLSVASPQHTQQSTWAATGQATQYTQWSIASQSQWEQNQQGSINQKNQSQFNNFQSGGSSSSTSTAQASTSQWQSQQMQSSQSANVNINAQLRNSLNVVNIGMDLGENSDVSANINNKSNNWSTNNTTVQQSTQWSWSNSNWSIQSVSSSNTNSRSQFRKRAGSDVNLLNHRKSMGGEKGNDQFNINGKPTNIKNVNSWQWQQEQLHNLASKRLWLKWWQAQANAKQQQQWWNVAKKQLWGPEPNANFRRGIQSARGSGDLEQRQFSEQYLQLLNKGKQWQWWWQWQSQSQWQSFSLQNQNQNCHSNSNTNLKLNSQNGNSLWAVRRSQPSFCDDVKKNIDRVVDLNHRKVIKTPTSAQSHSGNGKSPISVSQSNDNFGRAISHGFQVNMRGHQNQMKTNQQQYVGVKSVVQDGMQQQQLQKQMKGQLQNQKHISQGRIRRSNSVHAPSLNARSRISGQSQQQGPGRQIKNQPNIAWSQSDANFGQQQQRGGRIIKPISGKGGVQGSNQQQGQWQSQNKLPQVAPKGNANVNRQSQLQQQQQVQWNTNKWKPRQQTSQNASLWWNSRLGQQSKSHAIISSNARVNAKAMAVLSNKQKLLAGRTRGRAGSSSSNWNSVAGLNLKLKVQSSSGQNVVAPRKKQQQSASDANLIKQQKNFGWRKQRVMTAGSSSAFQGANPSAKPPLGNGGKSNGRLVSQKGFERPQFQSRVGDGQQQPRSRASSGIGVGLGGGGKIVGGNNNKQKLSRCKAGLGIGQNDNNRSNNSRKVTNNNSNKSKVAAKQKIKLANQPGAETIEAINEVRNLPEQFDNNYGNGQQLNNLLEQNQQVNNAMLYATPDQSHNRQKRVTTKDLMNAQNSNIEINQNVEYIGHKNRDEHEGEQCHVDVEQDQHEQDLDDALANAICVEQPDGCNDSDYSDDSDFAEE